MSVDRLKPAFIDHIDDERKQAEPLSCQQNQALRPMDLENPPLLPLSIPIKIQGEKTKEPYTTRSGRRVRFKKITDL